MQRGEIWMVDVPRPDGPPGREQYGDRPAVIVQRNTANQSTLIIVPITSNQNASRFESAFVVQPSPENGLSLPSVVITNQMRAIDTKRIRRQLGMLSAAHLQQLNEAIKTLLNL